MEFIARSYAKPVSAAKLAKLCGLSPSRFRSVFKEASGLSPAAYLVSFRMNVAATLLRHSASSVLEIAMASGYPTLSNFNRHFKCHFAISPRSYRRSRRE
jgi:transcriptional regulator GlxA family with amidase domain